MIQEIANLIKQYKEDSIEAARKIIEYLEDEGLSLEGNGWLDNDPLWVQESEQ